jgi:hypothetical protein
LYEAIHPYGLSCSRIRPRSVPKAILKLATELAPVWWMVDSLASGSAVRHHFFLLAYAILLFGGGESLLAAVLRLDGCLTWVNSRRATRKAFPGVARCSRSSPAENGQRATKQTPQGFDAQHGGELFRVRWRRLAAQPRGWSDAELRIAIAGGQTPPMPRTGRRPCVCLAYQIAHALKCDRKDTAKTL